MATAHCVSVFVDCYLLMLNLLLLVTTLATLVFYIAYY